LDIELPETQLEQLGKGRTLSPADGRGKANMIELPFVIIESEQKRAYLAAVCAITKPAHDAVSSAVTLHLEHGALARYVTAIDALRYDAIERTTGSIQSRLSFAAVQRVGRELE
jgi:hypothetical protein